MTKHLSARQIDEWIAGERPTESAEHLQACKACAAEVDRAVAPFVLLGGAVRAWAQEQTSPVRPRAYVRRQSAGAAWRLAFALAALLVFVAVPFYRHEQSSRRADAGAVAVTDEALLRQVESEVARSVPAPMEPLEGLIPGDLNR